jgi:hypothetical protein
LGNLHGIRIARCSLMVSHLLFADDLIIFSRANISKARVIQDCLSTYSRWFGQKINYSKSAIFFSKNYKPSIRGSIKSMLDLPHLSAKAKYLGIALFVHRSKKGSLADLKEKMLSKIDGWKSKLLSQAARTTLIKSVANAIPFYTMSLFLLPKGFCKELNSLLKIFWWGFP